MRVSWGVGALVAVLLSAVVYLFNILGLTQSIALAFLLVGLWTIVVAVTIGAKSERNYYAGWGIVMALFSLLAINVPFNYTLGLILIAIVALILLNVYAGRGPSMVAATSSPPRSSGDTPAASAI